MNVNYYSIKNWMVLTGDWYLLMAWCGCLVGNLRHIVQCTYLFYGVWYSRSLNVERIGTKAQSMILHSTPLPTMEILPTLSG